MTKNSYLTSLYRNIRYGPFHCTVAKYSLDALKSRQKELMERGLPKQKPIQGVKDIVLVSSGKGGVGKSTVATNLAAGLKLVAPDKKIGLLDTDIFGPTIPLMMNLHDTPFLTDTNLMEPLVNYGALMQEFGHISFILMFLQILRTFINAVLLFFVGKAEKFKAAVFCSFSMSFGFLIEESSPVIWRGLMVMQALQKLMRQVNWGDIDYLIVDTPPGTGDTHLSLVQNLPISGVVLVTTPQSAALQVTKRGAVMYNMLKIPIIGLIENMSSVECPNCSNKISIFGHGTKQLSEDLKVDILEQFPLNSSIAAGGDNGVPVVLDGTNVQSELYKDLAKKVVQFLISREKKLL